MPSLRSGVILCNSVTTKLTTSFKIKHKICRPRHGYVSAASWLPIRPRPRPLPSPKPPTLNLSAAAWPCVGCGMAPRTSNNNDHHCFRFALSTEAPPGQWSSCAINVVSVGFIFVLAFSFVLVLILILMSIDIVVVVVTTIYWQLIVIVVVGFVSPPCHPRRPLPRNPSQEGCRESRLPRHPSPTGVSKVFRNDCVFLFSIF